MRRWCGIVVLALVSACGGDDPESWEAGRPRIDRLRLLQQSPQDPLALEVAVDFSDSDGNLGEGTLRLLLDCEEVASRPLSEVFSQQTPSVAPDATEGSIEIIVRLTDAVQTGDKVRIGVILEDVAANKSNEPFFEIQAL